MKFILGLCLCLLSFYIQAQVNLVPNPSFEIYDTCPDYWGQIQRATVWVMVNGSPDYFNR